MGARPVELVAITDQVHMARGEAVNWLLVTDDTGVLMVDAGYPGDRVAVLASLEVLGYGPADVQAVLLTHAHIDHLGTATWLAKTYRTPVYCHADEIGHTRRQYLEQASPIRVAMRVWRPSWATWSVRLVRKGGLSRAGVASAQPLTGEVAATLPGRPVVVPSPGHTRGHCCYLFGRVLASGDALVTGHPVSSHTGPQLLPAVFSHSQRESLRSLAALGLTEAQVLAPGHGDVWRGPVAEAAQAAAALARRDQPIS